MKLKILLPLSFIIGLAAACRSDEESPKTVCPEPVKKLAISVESKEVYTSDVDFEFYIADGNGDYKATVSSDKDAKVDIPEQASPESPDYTSISQTHRRYYTTTY